MISGRFISPVVISTIFIIAAYGSAADRPMSATSERGMVVSVSPVASDIGRDVLRQGGNAVDASVAVALALAVSWPEAGNIGGGGFMMVLPPNGDPCVCVEYRETAPAASTPAMYQLGESHLGARMAGVPGTVRGLALAHQKFGRLPWADLVVPAIRLAREGFPVDAPLATSLNRVLSQESTRPFKEFLRVFRRPGGGEWRPGDRLTQPELAGTLQEIARKGADGFYLGPVAEKIVREMERDQGLITAADLASYRANVRTPIHVKFEGCDVYGPPPPSSGGIVLAEMLNTLSHFPLREQGRWSPETVHLLVETMKRAYCDRARYLGDPDFSTIPPELAAASHGEQLARSIDPLRATPSRELAPELTIVDEPTSTTHFSIVDADGMAVSNTYTLEQSFGSRVVVRGAGFLLNNEMGDFNWKPGHTDTTGNIGTPANVIAPGKRMLSSQTPVIVRRDGKVLLVTGSPGGRTIMNTVLCVLLNVLTFEMPLADAVAEPRLHHQWLPDEMRLEQGDQTRFAPLIEELKRRGHQVVPISLQGDAHSIYRHPDSGLLEGAADHRRGGKASGE